MNVILICALLDFSCLSEYAFGQNDDYRSNYKDALQKYEGYWNVRPEGMENALISDYRIVGTSSGIKWGLSSFDAYEDLVKVNENTYKSAYTTIVFISDQKLKMQSIFFKEKFEGFKVR